MLYEISHSDILSDNKPYKDAYRAEVLRRDSIRINAFANQEAKDNYGEIYKLQGINHRIENDCFVRDLIEQVWVVEINTLEQLDNIIKTMKPYFGLVYNTTNQYYHLANGEPLGEITIYNTYME